MNVRRHNFDELSTTVTSKEKGLHSICLTQNIMKFALTIRAKARPYTQQEQSGTAASVCQQWNIWMMLQSKRIDKEAVVKYQSKR